jgi:hypothetical protein
MGSTTYADEMLLEQKSVKYDEFYFFRPAQAAQTAQGGPSQCRIR